MCALCGTYEKSCKFYSGISVSFVSLRLFCFPLPLHFRLHTFRQTQISFWKQPEPTTDSWPGLFPTAASARNCSPSSMLNSRPQVSVELAGVWSRDQEVSSSSETILWLWSFSPFILQLLFPHGPASESWSFLFIVLCTPCVYQFRMAESSEHRQ